MEFGSYNSLDDIVKSGTDNNKDVEMEIDQSSNFERAESVSGVSNNIFEEEKNPNDFWNNNQMPIHYKNLRYYDPNQEVTPFICLSSIEEEGSRGVPGYYGFPADHDPSKSVDIFDSNSKFSGDKYMQSENLFSVNSGQVKSSDSNYSKLVVYDEMIQALESFGKPETPDFLTDDTSNLLRKTITNFLYRFKDRHPFSNPNIEGPMDVLDIVMDFLLPFRLLPSGDLLEEYSKSEVTRILNTLPSREHLNSQFDEDDQMSEKEYSKLKERYSSRPPFVFYFNPNFQIQEFTYAWLYYVGYAMKRANGELTQIGAGMMVWSDGSMYQGYWKDGIPHNYGRNIYDDGDIYEGGWKMGKKHGKGKYEYYKQRRIERGLWVEGKKQGEFEVNYKDGATHKIVYKDIKRAKE